MKSLLLNNKAPKTFEYGVIRDSIFENDGLSVAVGNNTYAEYHGAGYIEIMYHNSHIITLWGDGTVTLRDCGFKTQTTKRRLDMALKPLGKRLISRNYRWYIYTVATGELNPYFEGMIVRPEK